jgi:hypothetical protein
MNNLRDLFAYYVDLIDVFVLHHRLYRFGFCEFCYNLFSEDETEVSRILQPFWEKVVLSGGRKG